MSQICEIKVSLLVPLFVHSLLFSWYMLKHFCTQNKEVEVAGLPSFTHKLLFVIFGRDSVLRS